jgi:hypothetical protein
MAEHGLEGVPPRDPISNNTEELSHEALVRSLQSLIRENQQVYQQLRSPTEREVLPPETVIRNVLDWYAGSSDEEKGERFFALRTAWDALNYDRYEVGSREEGLAGSLLQSYHGATREGTVKLTDPKQVKMFDAMAESAGISRQRGQTEIEIPEHARRYNQYLMSEEYQRKFDEARARRNNPHA